MDRLERLTDLLLVLLGTDVPLTVREIVQRVPGYPDYDSDHEACRQLFERDKAILRDEGVPVRVEPIAATEQVGYRVLEAEYYLDGLQLSPCERAALSMAVAAVRLGTPAGSGALSKLGLLNVAGHDATPVFASLALRPALAVLHGAIRERREVTFTYRGERRQVQPYALAFRSGAWYAVGHDRDRDAVRTFRVDRIDGDPITGEAGSVSVPAGFDIERAVATEPWRMGDEPPVLATVAIDAVEAPRVRAELPADALREERPDGSILVELEVTNEGAFRSWLLGLLDHAVVTAPEGLRANVTGWLEAIARPGTTKPGSGTTKPGSRTARGTQRDRTPQPVRTSRQRGKRR